jgi:hypothetical protein
VRDANSRLDFERLFKLRLVVARHGEMDSAGWWNTRGILGRHGALALRRGFPSTHNFAQARIALAVARSRCHELFDPPGCMTLWHLPAKVEDRFEGFWQDWLDQGERWAPFFETLAGAGRKDLLAERRSRSSTGVTAKRSKSAGRRKADRSPDRNLQAGRRGHHPAAAAC